MEWSKRTLVTINIYNICPINICPRAYNELYDDDDDFKNAFSLYKSIYKATYIYPLVPPLLENKKRILKNENGYLLL